MRMIYLSNDGNHASSGNYFKESNYQSRLFLAIFLFDFQIIQNAEGKEMWLEEG